MVSKVKIGVIVLLFGIQFGLLVWYGSLEPAPQAGDYPGPDELSRDYNQYLGERVVVSGRVVATDPIMLNTTYGAGAIFQVTITGVSESVTRDEELRVVGIAREDRTIHATYAYTVTEKGRWYAYSVSLLAGLWVVGRLVRHWRFERTEIGLQPRRTPLDFRGIVRNWLTSTDPPGDADA